MTFRSKWILIGFGGSELLLYALARSLESPTFIVVLIVLMPICVYLLIINKIAHLMIPIEFNMGQTTGPLITVHKGFSAQFFLLPPIFLTVSVFQDIGPPIWFPGGSPAWILVPWALLGAAAVRGRWWEDWHGERDKGNRPG